ncbi:MAG: carboxyl transferase [Lachnospiraceae bacterium]|nr:carboxyl transferase [Lachnospiraceae bacterium]MDE6254109.1 carboxyl transferase [Lachnospiraceae bacterium]
MSTAANGSARQRIEALLDDNSFVEIGALVTARSTDFNLSGKNTPSDGVITGYGLIEENLVYVYSQDASVMNGTMGEMHSKKISGLYDMAMKMGAPVIGLIDCAGIRLQEATDALNAFGELYYKQSKASGVIPQISAVFGKCGGGLGILTELTDFTFMDTNNGKLFINSPNAIAGNNSDKCDTSSAKFQSEESGNADVIASESELIEKIRELVTLLPANNEDNMSYADCTDDLNRISENITGCTGDSAYALREISDDNFFFEMKPDYAKDMVTGFIKLNGMTVGAVANRSEVLDDEMNVAEKLEAVLTAKGCEKAADFVKFCDAFSIPVLTLTNAVGFKSCMCQEKKMAKAAARLTYAFAEATVPKVNVVTEKAYGSAYSIMNSKGIGADIVYAWEGSEIGMMDAELAAKIICSDKKDDINKTADEYRELQLNAASAAGRGYVDTMIKPEETRKYVIGAFEMLFTKREDYPAKKHGTV